MVWINSTNLFDAAAGFGGYRESGFGREGGREGLYEYLVPAWEKGRQGRKRCAPASSRRRPPARGAPEARDCRAIDRTAKLYIGGKQVRPDSGYSYTRPRRQGRAGRPGRPRQPQGHPQRRRGGGQAPAAGAPPRRTTARRCSTTSPRTSPPAPPSSRRACEAWPAASREARRRRRSRSRVRRIFYYAAQADKYDGQVHSTRSRHVTLAMNEPWGVMGMLCPRRGAAARLRLAGHAGDRHGQPRRRRAVAGRSAGRHRFLPGARHERRAGRRRQHRHRRARRAGEDHRRARRHRRRLVFRLGGGKRRGRGAPRSAISRRPGSITAGRCAGPIPSKGRAATISAAPRR